MILQKYLGRVVDIIYEDKKGHMTKRRIRIRAIANGKVSAYDIEKRSPRVFDIDRILAAQPVSRTA